MIRLLVAVAALAGVPLRAQGPPSNSNILLAGQFRAAIGYENAAWRPGLPGTQARALLAHALERVPEDLDDPRYVRALASLGRATAFTGDAERSRHLADLALGQARRLGDRQLLRHALGTMMWQRAGPDSVGGHLELATELLADDVSVTSEGYALEPLQRAFLLSRAETIYGGSSQIQRNIIGERVLGLPKEPRPG